jgi:gamma-glutamylaminecyclotransferase
MHAIFVYGTLRQGGFWHPLLENSEWLGTFTSKGWEMYERGIPFVIHGEGTITGELYRVDGETLARLDRLEGHPDWYKREPIVLNNGSEAEIYVTQDETEARGARRIPSGNYMEAR